MLYHLRQEAMTLVGDWLHDLCPIEEQPLLLTQRQVSVNLTAPADYIEARALSHVRGAPFHPQIQGKIEHWH